MVSLLGAIIGLFNRLLDLLDSERRNKAAQSQQEEMNALQKDPARWFGDHFNGVPNGTDKAPLPAKADNSGGPKP